MNISPAKRLEGINEYYFSKKLKEIAAMNAEGKQVLNLGIGSPDLPPSVSAIEKLVETAQLPSSHAYQSYIGIPALREAMAGFYQKHYQVSVNPTTEVFPLLGSKEGIMHICMTYLQEGDRALLPNPGYPTYRAAVSLAGAKCLDYKLKAASKWLPNLDSLAKKDLRKVKLMFVNYPHMPTGALATKGFYAELVHFAKEQNILIVNDNPYSFILNEHPLSILQVEGAKDVALELNSLSKSHNMAGWRVGMLVGKAAYVADVLRFKSNMDSGMFLPVQMAAIEALKADKEWFTELNSEYRRRQKKVFELLKLLGCKFEKTQSGLFVWAKVPPQYKSGFEVADKVLSDANVFITPGGIFGTKGDGYVRVSLCAQVPVFEEAIKRIKAAL
jgi:aspartate/methionine/tyrosine aminotransferase